MPDLIFSSQTLGASARAGSRPAVLARQASSLAVLLFLAACAGPPPPAPPPVASFGDFMPPSGQPHYLACPQNYCLAPPDELTPLIPVPADRMRRLVRQALDAQPRAEFVSVANEGLRLVYRQAAQGGTSLVTVDIVDADDGASGVAIYSQSETGERSADRDLVHRLLEAIARTAKSAGPRAG